MRFVFGKRKKVDFPSSLLSHSYPDSKVHGAYMGPNWGRQDPGGPHVGPMILAIWVETAGTSSYSSLIIMVNAHTFYDNASLIHNKSQSFRSAMNYSKITLDTQYHRCYNVIYMEQNIVMHYLWITEELDHFACQIGFPFSLNTTILPAGFRVPSTNKLKTTIHGCRRALCTARELGNKTK